MSTKEELQEVQNSVDFLTGNYISGIKVASHEAAASGDMHFVFTRPIEEINSQCDNTLVNFFLDVNKIAMQNACTIYTKTQGGVIATSKIVTFEPIQLEAGTDSNLVSAAYRFVGCVSVSWAL